MTYPTGDGSDGMGGPTRRGLLAMATAGALGGCLGLEPGGDGDVTDPPPTDDGTMTETDTATTAGTAPAVPTGTPRPNAAAWQQTTLTTARGGETFSVARLDPPVLVELFAVWCPVCERQQEAMETLLNRRDDLTAVSLNTDPNEGRQRVADHARENGYDWPFAVASPQFTDQLVDRFGPTVTSPPSAPVVRVCGPGGTLLPDGVKGADSLAAAVEEC